MDKQKEAMGLKGTHIISICDVSSERAKLLERMIEDVRLKRERLIAAGHGTREALHNLWLEYNVYLAELHKKFLVRQLTIENLTVTVGRSVLMQRLSGTVTYTGIVNYGALGTSATAPVIGNTQLGTETYRKALSSGTFSTNVAYLENFYTATEVSGTFEEYGFFIDGTGAANSGQLFNRFVTTTVKSNTESLNVQSIITLNSA